MTSGLRTVILASTVAASLFVPAVADAQRHYAVPRSRANVAAGAPYYRPYYRSSYYRPYYYTPFFYGSYGLGIGFGVGFGFGFGYPYSYPYYSPYYSPYYAPYFGAYGGYPYGAYPYYGYYDGSASLRLQVTPRETEVYVDGYYAGTVDSFDGTFQRLHIQPGEHDLQLYLPGHRGFSQKVYLQPVNTFRVRHTMEPLRTGDPEPVRPVAQTPPAGASRRPAPRSAPIPRDPDFDPDRDQDRDRAAIAPPEFGSLVLRVQPGDATVTIDGEPWSRPADDDRLIVQLGVGVHNVQIRKDGYRTYSTDVTVRRGETTPLNVAMTKQ